MKVLIVEDESPAARRLKQLIITCSKEIEILATLDSIQQVVVWTSQNPAPDLIFMDIQLADGISFEIFNKTSILSPIIFTTAYDEYALRAFKNNGIDYLLKPVVQEELDNAIQKYHQLKKQLSENKSIDHSSNIERLLVDLKLNQNYKSRFLIKIGEKMISILTDNIAYFSSEDKLVFAITMDGKRHPLDYSLDEIEGMVDPKIFFRLNRQYISKINAIQSIHNYFNGKLKLFLTPPTPANKEVVVSREKASHFKQWLEL
ncbi:MAG: DNA-binding response regulator [Cytophagales bacterium]|nr:MAG: DNA-binding response regulator [Cytophagales bacterium]